MLWCIFGWLLVFRKFTYGTTLKLWEKISLCIHTWPYCEGQGTYFLWTNYFQSWLPSFLCYIEIIHIVIVLWYSQNICCIYSIILCIHTSLYYHSRPTGEQQPVTDFLRESVRAPNITICRNQINLITEELSHGRFSSLIWPTLGQGGIQIFIFCQP